MSDKLFFHTDTLYIYNDDLLTTSCVPEGSVDLIITSPPYNVDIQYGVHDDQMTYQDYLDFTRQWIKKCRSIYRSL